ncbi:glycosyltransferase family 2 protein [Candidatus Kaiserbacteria bacterium]|nr:glycosyltransferase family 2 protein [Candidatus Kaiserbacteria bacterium]
MKQSYSIILPAYNEAAAIGAVLVDLQQEFSKEEIIVVDDCSTDGTAAVAARYPVTLLRNVQNFGYGYSLKRGIKSAVHEHVIILDADGSYPVAALAPLVAEYEKGFDMVVGTRQGSFYHGPLLKRMARACFRALSEFATGRTIPDINSGCRIFRKDLALRFFHTLSTGFSFTTTITLAFLLNAYAVRYLPIEYHKRTGNSKVRYLRDTLRSAQIITEAIIFYNPLKMFLLCAAIIFCAGIASFFIGFYSPPLAFLFFFTIAASVATLALGFIAVFLKFTHDAHS